MLEVAEKLLIAPFVTVISLAAKFVVGSLDVNVNDKLALLVVEPLVAVIAGLLALLKVENGTTPVLADDAVPVPLVFTAATRKT